MDAVLDAFGEFRPEDVPPSGIQELREAVARHAGVLADETAVTAGGSLAITTSLTATWWFHDVKSQAALVPVPCYPQHWTGPLLRGFRVSGYPAEALRDPHKAAALAVVLANESPHLLIINTPHNPTGIVARQDILERIVRTALAAGWAVLLDETFAGLELAVPGPPLPHPRSRLMRVASLGKRFPALADSRVGYLIADVETAQLAATIHRCLAVGPSVAAQKRACAVLEKFSRGDLASLRGELRAQLEFVEASLGGDSRFRVLAPEGGIFVRVMLPAQTDCRAVAERIREATGIWCSPAPAHRDGGNWLRLRIGQPRRQLRRVLGGLLRLDLLRRH